MKLQLTLLTLILLGTVSTAQVFAQTPTSGSALSAIQNAFAQVSRAQSQGANVTLQVSELNQALQLVSEGQAMNSTASAGYYSQAISIASQVVQQLPQATNQGRAAAQFEVVSLGTFLGALGVAGFIIYFYGSRVFWRLWIRTHRGWTVRRSEGE